MRRLPSIASRIKRRITFETVFLLAAKQFSGTTLVKEEPHGIPV